VVSKGIFWSLFIYLFFYILLFKKYHPMDFKKKKASKIKFQKIELKNEKKTKKTFI
jgi:hypothetical protein